MTRLVACWVVGCLVACGDRPLGSHLPRPEAGEAAGVAAAAAAAVTLADPEAAMRAQAEQQEAEDARERTVRSQPMPGAVIERLEHPAEPSAPAIDAGVPDAPATTTDEPTRAVGRDRGGPRPDLRLPPRPPAP